MFKAFKTELGLRVFYPEKFEDNRGIFFETFRLIQIEKEFVQENLSISKKGVIRGMHLQTPPHCQSKLINIISGRIFDVSICLLDNHNYGKYECFELSAGMQIYIPSFFAHGFQALENNTIISYKVDKYYNKYSEKTILYNDKDLDIKWPIKEQIVSEKDKKGIEFKNIWN